MKTTLILALTAASIASADRLPPVDESAADPSFAAFKTRLLRILERRDVQGLISTLDPQIRAGFGEKEGIDAFHRYWKLDQPAQSRIWNELGKVLRLGVTRDDPEFIAPYVFTKFPHTVDAFRYAAVTRAGAAMHESSSSSSKVVATTDYDIVELLGGRQNGWVEARTYEGATGWLPQGDVRSPIEYRAFFEKKGGDWKMTAFVTGD